MLRMLVFTVILALVAVAAWLLLGPEGHRPSRHRGAGERDASESPSPPVLRGGKPEAPAAPGGQEDRDGATADPAEEAIRVEGRVIDERRRPVAGAAITVRRGGEIVANTKSNAQGEFVVSPGSMPATIELAGLQVIEGDRCARMSLYLRPRMRRAFSLGSLVLRPTSRLDALVTVDGTPAPGARVVVMDARDTRSTGRMAEARTDGRGRVHLGGLAASRVRVFAHVEGRGRGMVESSLPPESVPVRIELPPDRTLDVTVKHAVTGEPVSGAEVFVSGRGTTHPPLGTGCLPELPPLHTDQAGYVRVTGLPAGHLRLVARGPASGLPARQSVSVPPEATEAEVLLHSHRNLRFPIRPSSAGAPAEGTPLEVVRYQPVAGDDDGSVRAYVADDHVVIESFPPNFDWGHVLAPDGRWASFRAPAPVPGRTVEDVFFRPSRDVIVRLTTTDGRVLAGEWLWLLIRPRGRGVPQRTDERGLATWPRLQGERAIVMWTPEERGFGTPVAEVKLGTLGDVTQAVVEAPARVRIAVTIDGKPGLPVAYSVHAPDTDPRRAGQARDVIDPEIEEDVETGEVAFRWLPPSGASPFEVTIEADGYAPVTVALAQAADGTWEGVAALRKATVLTVRVVPPEDPRWHVMLERWDEGAREFLAAPNESSMRPARGGTREVQRYECLRPGRYRLRELVTKHTSAPFDVGTGGVVVEVPFDLSVVVLVEGKVLLPEGEDAAFAQVVVDKETEPGRMPERPTYVSADGKFQYRALRGRRLKFRVTHPLLRAAAGGGVQEIVVGEETPVLRLERGVEVVFRIEGSDFTTPAPDARVYGGPHFSGPVLVRAAPADEWTSEIPALHALGREGTFRLAIQGPGRWTLRVEMEGHVPIDLKSVEIKEGVNDLGTLQPVRGARLRLLLQASGGALPAFVQAKAVYMGEVPYSRSAWKVEPGDPPYVVIEGLGPGRFRVTLSLPEEPKPGRGGTAPRPPQYVPRFEQEVESDGEREIVVEVDLR